MKSAYWDNKTYLLLLIGIILIVAALIVKVDDNPPGIILAYVGSLFLVLAFTHKFDTSKSYVLLLISSVAAFVVFGILHNLFEGIGDGLFFEVVGVFFFLCALFLCPVGIIVGIIGIIMKSIKKEQISKAKVN